MGPLTNDLLQRLPLVYRRSLLASTEQVDLQAGKTLFEPQHSPEYAHFILSGVVSVATDLEDGNSAEAFSVGHEGLVEATHLLGAANSPARATTLTECCAARMRLSDLRRQFTEYHPLRTIILGYVQARACTLEQLAACNRHHEVDARLARWLLTMQDRMDADAFPITQEMLAQLLGTQRTTVTLAAKSLQVENTIAYSRGKMRILDRKQLEEHACECYRIVRALTLHVAR